MPPRRSEAYEDPLRSVGSTTTRPTSSLGGGGGGGGRSGGTQEKERFVTLQEAHIEWSNLIFLPFHPVFKMFVLASVFIKSVLGPIQSVYPIVYCYDVMENNPFLVFIRFSYWYGCDPIYGIDTFLHIVHRQVVDKAMRREHLPKSAFLLLLDLFSLIPFFHLLQSDPCPPARLWPNILANNEFVVIYRVTEYFQLITTHSYVKLMFGYGIVLCICVNCVTCFWLLLTYEGLCARCNEPSVYYDWRAGVVHKLNETNEEYTTFVYGAMYIFSFGVSSCYNECLPSAVYELAMLCLFVVFAYVLENFVVMPKVFSESMLRFRRICTKYPIVQKITDETKRRNPKLDFDKTVEHHYKMLWRHRYCITSEPEFFYELPRYLRLEITQDLLWPFFFHSPTLRKTSYPFRRWLSESTRIIYKLPGEKFYTEDKMCSTLFYLKSGIIQLISMDDGTTPILSLTSGTILGDINFYVPHKHKRVKVRCLTYCEVYFVHRDAILRALHKYPLDRATVLKDANERIKHAKILFTNKTLVRGLDRNEDEGIAWLRRRWWELYNMIEDYTKKTGETKETLKGNLPRDETVYHCAKYIGQLALCTNTELQTKSMFTNFKFPWILNPHSRFGYEWYRIVSIDVYLVLILYPANLILHEIPRWFTFFSFFSDLIYAMDIGVSLFTAIKTHEETTSTFAAVMFERFKSFTFMLDILSTIWLEDVADLAGATEYHYTLQFNRLIKIYMLFYGDYLKFDVRSDPIVNIFHKFFLLQFANLFVVCHLIFELIHYFPQMSMMYFFGKILCSKTQTKNCEQVHFIFGVAVSWLIEMVYSEYIPESLIDIYYTVLIMYSSYIIHVFCKGRFCAYVFLGNRNIIQYKNFVANLKNYYNHYRIHQDLLRRLDRYLVGHWRYYQGTDVMYSNSLTGEAFEIYWKAQGAVAKRTIEQSEAFRNADTALVKDLARSVRFLMLPKNLNIYTFGLYCKNVTWVVQGYAKSEYYDEKGDLQPALHGPGCILSGPAVLLRRPNMRTFTTNTDCEIIYIPMKEFYTIYMRHPIEYSFVRTCVKEFSVTFENVFKSYFVKHRKNQTKLRDRIYSTRMSMVSNSKVLADIQDTRSLPVEGFFWGEPESGFMQSWMLFRVIVVCISITCASMLGGVGAVSRWIFMMLSAFCDCISFVDIVIKICVPYYNKQGLYITDKKKCAINYLTKGFILDLVGALPWFSVLKALLAKEISDDDTFLINTVCKMAHIYILFAYFSYITDVPTLNHTLIMIIKWQIVNILLVMACSHYLMINCVRFQFNEDKDLTDVTLRRDICWMPQFFKLPDRLSGNQLHLIFASSLNLAESGMTRMNFGRFVINREYLGVGFVLFTLGLMFWFISCYTLILLVLNRQGDTVYQHSVIQLTRFLKSERVEPHIIQKVLKHFKYVWLRTKGINIQQLTNDRIGVVFRQDLSIYFYKKTFTILDTILGGGEAIQRNLASASDLVYFLPGHDIFREMDIVSHVCIVHRGKVNISKDGKKLIILSKGDIFGQLVGSKLRPLTITATAEDHVDLLYIDVGAFQDIITLSIRRRIAKSVQAKSDYMATKNMFIENPYDSIQYILRGRKTIQLPKMKNPMEARLSSWYGKWLYLSWIFCPYIATFLVVGFLVLPEKSILWFRFYCVLIITDVVNIANFVAEFYTIELMVDKKKCVYRRSGKKILKNWAFYADILSILLPLVTIITNDFRFQLARILRLKFFVDFEFHFCRGFKSRIAPLVLKVSFLTLILHVFTCGWIYFACRYEVFPLPIVDMRHMNHTIDFSTWAHPAERVGGCARVIFGTDNEAYFVVPRFWPNDYLVALTYVLLLYTSTPFDIVLPINIQQIYYKVFATFFVYLLDVYMMSVAINFSYIKFRELYQYDYNADSVLIYLANNGLCKSLLDIVLQYTQQVWERQKGDWLPELAYQGPQCLRQDLFCSLYMHHLDSAPIFRHLPYYFKRQLSTRLQRIVVFPGKCVVREGDTFNTTYFIHEGEVEKWFTDPNGEGQLMSVLYTNGYFGCIAGLFANAGFQFSYYTRTVVDLVYLELANWEDLLDNYPDIKANIYSSAKQHRKALTRNIYGKSHAHQKA